MAKELSLAGAAAPRPANPRDWLRAARALAGEGRHAQALELIRSSLSADDPLDVQSRAAAVLRRAPGGSLGLRPLRLALLASSTVDHLAEVVRLWLALAGIEAEIHVTPFDTAEQSVLEPGGALHAFRPQLAWLFSTGRDIAIHVAPGASRDEAERAVREAVLARSAFCALACERLGCAVLQNNADLPADDPEGHLSGAAPWGRRTLLRQFNALLPASMPPGAMLFDLDQVASSWGLARWVDPRLWFHSKHAFAPDASGHVAFHAARVIAAHQGLSRKCLVLDLDNTLWGGVIGDDGLAGIVLGQGAEGEAFVAFQRYVQALRERGVVLAVCSKNERDAALEPFRRHPDMVLRESDIAVFRANWDDKVSNLRAIADALGLATDALAFVDDNPVERALVREHLPEVAVVEMPDDPALYVSALARSALFEAIAVSDEDRRRAGDYAANAQRSEAKAAAVDMASFLTGLELRGRIAEADDIALPRIAQLINKSNQFHLTGVRLSEAELRALRRRDDHRLLGFRLADRFGDNGLVSAVVLRRAGNEAHVDVWVMSCRVLGRSLEEFVANAIHREARAWGCSTIVGRYVASQRNGLVSGLYARLGFAAIAGEVWRTEVTAQEPRWATWVAETAAAGS